MLGGEKKKKVGSSDVMDAYHEIALNSGDLLKDDPSELVHATLSHLQEDEDAEVFYVEGFCGCPTPLVHPDHPRLTGWIGWGILFIIYEIFITPYRLCFTAPAKGIFFGWEVLVNSYFIIDVCLKFFVSFHDAQGRLVRSQARIIKTYLKGWFIIDVVASIPVDWIEIVLAQNEVATSKELSYVRFLRPLRMIRLARVLRAGKMASLVDRFEQEFEGSHWHILMFSFFKIIVILYGIAHVAGCFWFLVGMDVRFTDGWRLGGWWFPKRRKVRSRLHRSRFCR